MSRLPILSGRAIIKALVKVGTSEVRQRGSHIRLSCAGKKSITVPDHNMIGHGLFKKVLRDAELSVEDFLKLL